jgi:hypothetical protein
MLLQTAENKTGLDLKAPFGRPSEQARIADHGQPCQTHTNLIRHNTVSTQDSPEFSEVL